MRTVIENTKRSATIADMRSLGAKDGAFLSDVAAGLMGSIAEKRAVFEP